MAQMLWGRPPLTAVQRGLLTERAVTLCIERNGVLETMSKCIIVRSYRELWVLDPEHPNGQRVI